MCSSSCWPIYNITLSLLLSFLNVSATVSLLHLLDHIVMHSVGSGELEVVQCLSRIVKYMLFVTAIFFTIQMSFSTHFSFLMKLFHFETISILSCKNNMKNSCIPFTQLPQMLTSYVTVILLSIQGN